MSSLYSVSFQSKRVEDKRIMSRKRRDKTSEGRRGDSRLLDAKTRSNLRRVVTSQAMKDLICNAHHSNDNLNDSFLTISRMLSHDGNNHDIASTFFIYNDVSRREWKYVKTYLFLNVVIRDETLRKMALKLNSMEQWFDFLDRFHFNFGNAGLERTAAYLSRPLHSRPFGYALSCNTKACHVDYDVYTMIWSCKRCVNPESYWRQYNVRNRDIRRRVCESLFFVEVEDIRYEVCDNVRERLQANGNCKSRGRRKPNASALTPNVEDEYDLNYRPDEDEMRQRILDEYDEQACADDLLLQDTANDDFVTTSAQNDDDIITEDDHLSVVSNLTLPTLDGHLIVYGDTVQDIALEQDEWVDDFSLSSSFSMLPLVAQDDITDSWEVVSTDGPAVLVEAKAKSYCDAVRLGNAPPATMPTIHRLKKHPKRAPRTLRTIPEDDEPVDFDSEFIMEGVKNSCGGKASLRFKGNQKRKQK